MSFFKTHLSSSHRDLFEHDSSAAGQGYYSILHVPQNGSNIMILESHLFLDKLKWYALKTYCKRRFQLFKSHNSETEQDNPPVIF